MKKPVLYKKWEVRLLSTLIACLGLTLSMMAQNAPVAGDDENFTYQDISISGNVFDNDYDLDGDNLTFSIVSSTPNGTWDLQPDGNYTYTPNPLVIGIENMVYQACDEDGQCTQATLTMYVIFLNDAPQANDDTFNAELNTTRTFNARLNDVEPDNEVMLFYMVVPPANGTASIQVSTGIITYTPNNGYTGPDSFTYQACDPCNVCNQAAVTVNVLPANEPPIFTSVSLNATEDQMLTGSLASFASDPDNDNLTFGLITNSPNGNVTISANGNFTFTPNPQFNGLTSFYFTACDIVGQCTNAIATVQVAAVNDSPVAQDDAFALNEDNILNANVSTNDSDVDLNNLSYAILTQPLHGTINISNNGAFAYTPNSNYFGADSFSYQVCDPSNACDQGSVTLTIAPINDMPIVTTNEFNINEDNVLTTNLSNVSDVDSEIFTYAYITGLENGTITINPSGTFTYVPDLNWYGSETISFSVCDNSNGCTTGELIINVAYVNDAPEVVGENFTIDEDEIATGNLSLNDNSQDEGNLNYSLSSTPLNGDVVILSNGTFTYTPNANWFGIETINYVGCNINNACDGASITIQVNPINDAPECFDQNITMDEDGFYHLQNALAIDIDNPSLSTELLLPNFGNVALNAPDDVIYTPNQNYSGPDTFSITFCDANDLCCTATVSCAISPINDTPTTNDGAANGLEDQVLNGTLPTYADIDNDVITYSIVSQPINGQITITSNGNFSYTPDPHFNGIDVFTFSACDPSDACDAAVYTIDITAVNDLPNITDENNVCPLDQIISGSLSQNDSDIESTNLSYTLFNAIGSGSVEISIDGQYTFTPSEIGETTIIYEACDENGGCAFGTLSITTIDLNTAPTGADGNILTFEDQVYSGSINSFVSDAEGGTMSFTLLTSDEIMAITLNTNGQITITPAVNYYGIANFTYQVCDNGNLCDEGIVTVTIQAVNDAPIASELEIFGYQDQTIAMTLNTQITDDGDGPFTFALLDSDFPGDVSLAANGQITLDPNPVIFGQYEITYEVCDEGGLCDQITAPIYIAFLNDVPEAIDGAISTNEEQDYSGDLQEYVYEADQETVTFSLLQAPNHGTINLLPNGSYTYSPDPEFSGFDEFTFMACDPSATCASGNVLIEVVFMNDLPVAVDDFFMVLEDDDINGSVANNDVELDDEIDSYSILTPPAHGTIVLNENGTFSYTPNPNYYGLDQLVYMMCDPCGACDVGVLAFEVTFINDMPVVEDESIFVYQNTFYEGSVATNDYELDIEELTYFIVDDNSGGLFELYDDGSYYFVPGDDALGLFTLEYMACDPCGACSFGTLTIEVAPLEGGNTAPILNPVSANVCIGSTLTLDLSPYVFDLQDEDSMLDIYNYLPDYGYAEINGTILTYVPDPNYIGTINIQYEGCDTGTPSLCSSNEIEINISPLDYPTITDLYVENVLCYGEQTGFIDIIEVNAIGNPIIVWADGDTASYRGNLAAGEYAFTISTDAACSVSTSFSITVSGPLSPIQINADIVGINDSGNGTIDLGLSGGLEPYSLSWSGASGTQDGTSLIDIGSAGTYYVTIEDANGCSIDTSFTVTSIDEWGSATLVELWPNPAINETQLLIAGLQGLDAQLQIIDVTGKIISSSKLGVLQNYHQITIDTRNYVAGTYYIQVYTSRGKTSVPFIKM